MVREAYTTTDIEAAAESLSAAMNDLLAAEHRASGYTHPADGVRVNHDRKGRKFLYIDIGTSGAFLVERATGELFNIKAYGVPDYNKKRKSDLGNVMTADPARVLAMRYNYLR